MPKDVCPDRLDKTYSLEVNGMALVQCPDCGTEISHVGLACPKCGRMNSAQALKHVNCFKNPANGFVEKISGLAWLWVFLFGPIYFAVKGVWRHVFMSIAIGVITMGVSIFVYPFYAGRILRKEYLRRGWLPCIAD